MEGTWGWGVSVSHIWSVLKRKLEAPKGVFLCQMTHRLLVGPADGDGLVLGPAEAQAPGCSPAGQRQPSVGPSSLWVSLYIDHVNTPVKGWSQSTGSPGATGAGGVGTPRLL